MTSHVHFKHVVKACRALDGMRHNIQMGVCRLTVRLNMPTHELENTILEHLIETAASTVAALLLARAQIIRSFVTQFPGHNLSDMEVDYNPYLPLTSAGGTEYSRHSPICNTPLQGGYIQSRN